MLPLGERVPIPKFFWSHDLELWWNMRKMVKNDTFWQKMCRGRGTPWPYPQNSHTQQFPVPTLPIHYDTFTVLRRRLRGATRRER